MPPPPPKKSPENIIQTLEKFLRILKNVRKCDEIFRKIIVLIKNV